MLASVRLLETQKYGTHRSSMRVSPNQLCKRWSNLLPRAIETSGGVRSNSAPFNFDLIVRMVCSKFSGS